jgi:hypothetical protein
MGQNVDEKLVKVCILFTCIYVNMLKDKKSASLKNDSL